MYTASVYYNSRATDLKKKLIDTLKEENKWNHIKCSINPEKAEEEEKI